MILADDVESRVIAVLLHINSVKAFELNDGRTLIQNMVIRDFFKPIFT